MLKKVLICDPISEEGVEMLREGGLEVDEDFDLSKEGLIRRVPKYHALIVRSSTEVDEDVLTAADKLEVIGRPGIGLDNIDLDLAEEIDVEAHNTPTATTVSVAELATTHMLAAFRDIVAGTESLRNERWIKDELEGQELSGKTLGIIGYGNIGQAVAERTDAFGMNIVAYDVREIENPEPSEMVNMERLLEESDVITIHLPLNESTRNLVDRKKFKKMKDSAILIDVSRGGIVDEDDLLEALEEGEISFASKDVFEREPPGENPLLDLENFHATPHIGAQTHEGQKRAAIRVAEKVIETLKTS